jgi:cell division protein FtsB
VMGANKELLDVYKNIKPMVSDYRKEYEELSGEIETTIGRIRELKDNPYLTTAEQEELEELRGKYRDLTHQVNDLKEEHSEAIKQMIADMAFQRLAAEGWTKENMEKYLAIERGLGLIDDAGFTMAQSLIGNLEGILDGTIEVEDAVDELEDSLWNLDGINTSSSHTHTIYTEYEGETSGDGVGGQFIGDSDTGHRALGGPVMADRPYIVGERGPELYIPRVQGSIISNSELMRALGNENMTPASQTQVINRYEVHTHPVQQSRLDPINWIRRKEALNSI